MNKKRLAELADYLEARKVDMALYSSFVNFGDAYEASTLDKLTCDTVGCIAGWAAIKNYGEYVKFKRTNELHKPADFFRHYYGLTHDETTAFCYPHEFSNDGKSRVSRTTQKKRALEVLRGQRPLNNYWLVR